MSLFVSLYQALTLYVVCREEDPDDVPHGHITSLVSLGYVLFIVVLN